MQHLEVSGAVRPLKWSLGVKWLRGMCPSVHQPLCCIFKTGEGTLLYIEVGVNTICRWGSI